MNDKMDHSNMNHTMTHTKVKPTWVTPHPTTNKLYVAANGSNEIIEVDVDSSYGFRSQNCCYFKCIMFTHSSRLHTP